jgi:hypothetical protein
MDIRERLEEFWAGDRPDVIPFTIYEWEWQPTQHDPAWQGLFKKGMGVTWHLSTTKDIWPNGVELRDFTAIENGKTMIKRVISTPVGEICELYEDNWRLKHYLETAEDYAVMTYLAKNLEVAPCYDEYLAKEKSIAPYGVGMASIGRTPNQIILVDLVGLEKYAYHLFDLQAEMEELYYALFDNFRARVEMVAEGPGKFVSVLENFSADSLGPRRFKQLLLPVYDECFPILRQAGKIIGTHYDGQLSSCKDMIANAPIDLIESLTPPPEGDLTLAEARAAWPDKLFWSNINVACYELPPEELKAEILKRVEEAAVEKINAKFPEIHASPSGDFASESPNLQSADILSRGISILAVLVGGIGMMNTMLMSTLERTREIGVLRALGWRRGAILRLIMSESLVLGLLGALVGMALSLGWVTLIQTILIQDDSLILLWTMENVIRALVIALGLALMGGFYPALRATRMQPVEALRYE